MKRYFMIQIMFFIGIAFGFQSVSAQFTIKIPKLPKIEKPKQEQTKTEDNSQTRTAAATTNKPQTSDIIYKNMRPTGAPVLLKNSIYIQAETHNEYWKMPNESNFSSWIPMIKFSQYYDNDKQLNYAVEYFKPDGTLWFSETLEQGFRAADWTVSWSSSNPFERLNTKSAVGTGVYSFKITNQDTKEVIFQGKFKVGKFSTATRQEKNKFDFFVEHDWLLPFGMVGFQHGDNFETEASRIARATSRLAHIAQHAAQQAGNP